MRRLGKQRVECYQILRTLTGISDGWKNHPATKMWRGHERLLSSYALIVCLEWRERGYKDTLLEKIQNEIVPRLSPNVLPRPSWLGNEDFHRSHRANLVRKDPTFYTPKFGALPDEPYIWPTP